MNARANLVTLVQGLPRILLHLLHTETDATCSRIDTQHFDFNHVARIDDLARMLHALGPTHLRNMYETFNTGLELDERAVVGNARNTSTHACTNRETFFNAGPRIRQQLFVTERDALAVAIKLQHLH